MSALVPVGRCPACAQLIPGTTTARYLLCTIRVGLHTHPRIPAWCIGSWSLARPALTSPA